MRVSRLIFRIVLAIILILISIPLLWGSLTAFEPEIILYQAKRIAGDRPYCIVVSDTDRPFHYKSMRTRSDLTFGALAVRTDWGGSSGPYQETYYSLLILRDPDEIRNWSKLYLNFESDANPTQSSLFHVDFRRLCTPVIDFAKSFQ